MLPSSVRREATLGADAEVAQRNVLGRFFNAMLGVGWGLPGAVFGGNQTEDHLINLRYGAMVRNRPHVLSRTLGRSRQP